jgi:hypothetical protein
MSMAIRLAGFENRDTVRHNFGVPAIGWTYSTGFPKARSQFKPAWEPILVFRKSGPLREYRIDECRVEGVPRATGTVNPHAESGVNGILGSDKRTDRQQRYDANLPSGRWPSNTVFSHTASCVKVGQKDVKGSHSRGSAGSPSNTRAKPQQATLGKFNKQSVVEHVNPDGKETVADWRCAEGCAVSQLDLQSGVSKSTGGGGLHLAGEDTKHGIYGRFGERNLPPNVGKGDVGGASRFYHQFSPDADLADLPTFIYQAKAGRSERERGCEGINDVGRGNTHVSVKPLQLMRHLCRLVTPVGGTVIDPFAGSGTTGCAAMLEGLSFLGAEREPEYVAIARARIGYHSTQPGRVAGDGVAPQKKSIVAPQKNTAKLRSLRSLPKRVT